MCDFIQQKRRYYNSKILGKNTIASPFSKLYTHKTISMSSLNVSILCIKFYKIPCNGDGDKIIIGISEIIRILEEKV